MRPKSHTETRPERVVRASDHDEPADGEDAQEGCFLAPWDLEAPDAADGDDGDEEVGEDVDGGVDVPDAAGWLVL